MRPMLAPGLRVVARGRDRLQVGIGERCVVVPRTAPHAPVLDALLDGRTPPADPASRSVIAELVARGVVVDAIRRRTPVARVALLGDLGTDPEPHLAAARLRPVEDRWDVGLALSTGEADRDRLDRWVRDGLPHLVVRLVDGEVVLGPLVVPGRTACLRCVDEHRADEDPDHLAVLHRYTTACRSPRPDGVPDPADPLLATLATCWAAHDLRSHLTGDRPATWSATLTLGGPDGLTAAAWPRHPACWCAWT
jgi:bacteriocin biosynthesis cyclodehydratase domain-containing protein